MSMSAFFTVKLRKDYHKLVASILLVSIICHKNFKFFFEIALRMAIYDISIS
jgi:hypothetical protein